MKSFISGSTDVYYNLALEKFLTHHTSDNYFFLWRSTPCVVIGKHQNPYKELNLPFVIEKNIAVSRRISGGGAVYHDLGNVNFSFIKNVHEGKQIDFKKHSSPIFKALTSLGFDITICQRNDMRINGMKFSGNAEHVYKNRVLHHGTILFDTNLDILNSALQSTKKYSDKSIASVRSIVTNLKDFSLKWDNTKSFMLDLFQSVLSNNMDYISTDLSQVMLPEVERLRLQKFILEDWVWGYTPKYELESKVIFLGKKSDIKLVVKKGIVEDVLCLNGNPDFVNQLRRKLINQAHTFKNFQTLLQDQWTGKQILNYFF